MRLYWELARRSMQRHLTYRAAALAGLVTNLFWGLLRASVMIALYAGHREVAGMSMQEAITYTALTQAIISFLSLFGWYDVMNGVYSGAVATDLLKPMEYYTFWLSQDLGRALTQLLLRGIPLVVIYAFFYPIVYPRTPVQWLELGVAMILALMVSFSYRFLVNLSAFWVQNALGVGRMAFFLPLLLSGFVMPMRFLPEWFSNLCWLTPFPHAVTTVVDVYLGLLDGEALFRSLGLQLLWVVILTGACQLALNRGIRRLVILGG